MQHHPNWKGSNASYDAKHKRVRGVRGSAHYCIHRRAIGCTSERFEWAHIHGLSYDDVYNFVAMCKSCHNIFDGIPRNMPPQRGANNPRAKLTDDQVIEIRARHTEGGVLQRELALEYDVSDATVSRIVRGERLLTNMVA